MTDPNIHVPGRWHCAKCDFQLVKSNLNTGDGSMTANTEPGGKCPNCDSPMWPVTWQSHAKEGWDCVNDFSNQISALTTELDRLRASPSYENADWFWRTLDPDDSGTTPEEALHAGNVPDLMVCEVASSFTGDTRFGFTCATLDPTTDDTEFLHFSTLDAADTAALERAEALKDAGVCDHD